MRIGCDKDAMRNGDARFDRSRSSNNLAALRRTALSAAINASFPLERRRAFVTSSSSHDSPSICSFPKR